MDYKDFSPKADKFLKPDGSITTFNGTIVSPPNAARAADYNSRSPMAAKFLLPDGTIVTRLCDGSGGGSGGIGEAPTDGKLYGRQNKTWVEVPEGGGGFDDAPADGNIYGRQNETWVEVPTDKQPTGVLFPIRTDGITANLTHEMPTESQTVTDRTWVNANWGEWTDITTFTLADDVEDKEVEFVPGNRFYGRFWISSDVERPNTQLRLRLTDATDDTELVVATTVVNLLNISSIHTPVAFNSKHLQLRVMPLSQVRVTLQAMVLTQGVQIGIVSNVPDELSYLTLTSVITDEVSKIPLSLSASMEGVPLSGYSLTIQAAGSGLQTINLDENGEFLNYLDLQTEYTFTVLPQSSASNIFTTPKTITTGIFDMPLDVHIDVGSKELADNRHVNSIAQTVSDNVGIDITGTVTTFGNVGSSTDKWRSLTLAPNGKIYGIPTGASTVLEIDPVTNTATMFGNVGSDTSKWIGGVLAPNGKIYGIPSNGTTVLEIDPATNTTATFGNVGSVTSKWQGGVLAPNGKIYGIPRISSTVLEIDPVTNTTATFGNVGSDISKWAGGVLAPNGKIYGIPLERTTVLEIDPVTNTTTTFGNVGSGTGKWIGGVLAPNGKIYGIPTSASTVLEIDPATNTATMFGNVGSDTGKWIGGALAPNGKIYGIPTGASTVLEIDPVTNTTTTFGNVGSGTGKWSGGVLAPNGKIYGIPHSASTALIIDFAPKPTNFYMSVLLSAYLNKF